MIHIEDATKCCGCSACEQICPRSAIRMTEDREGFLYPRIDSELCIDCGLCDRVCPMSGGSETAEEPAAYAYKTRCEDVRASSSSGGAFTDAARLVLQEGGVVFGAVFDESFGVLHTYAESEDGLAPMRGSKYTQSRMEECYKQAEEFLKKGRTVLFTGTPCQVFGLRSYLRREYSNLLTADFICHGVPSPAVWQRYVAYRTDKAGGKTATAVSFRDKHNGWKRYAVCFSFDGGGSYRMTHSDDFMMQAFLQDLCLRPSCYECPFRKTARKSDITLADFWGIGSVLKGFDDDRGTSLLLVHSEKGKRLLDRMKVNAEFAEVPFQESVAQNPAYWRSVSRPQNREAFLADALNGSFEEAVLRHRRRVRFPFLRKIKRILKKILGR